MRTPSNVVKRFVACGAPRALRQRLQWQWWQRSGVPSTRKATPPHRQLPRGVPVPGSGGGTSGRTVVSTAGGKASKRGRSSGMSYHGALKPTKMCPSGRRPGSSSSAPADMKVKSCQAGAASVTTEPQRRQNFRKEPGEDSKRASCPIAAGKSRRRCSCGKQKDSSIAADGRADRGPAGGGRRPRRPLRPDPSRRAQARGGSACEAEVEDRLGRAYYRRGDGESQGYRNGYRRGRLKSAEGAIEYAVPQVSDLGEPYRSRVRERLGGRTEELERLAVEMYARGLSTRDIESTFADEHGRSLLSRTAVSEVTERLWEEYEAFATRDLSEHQLLYLFVDDVAERLRPGLAREAVLCAWGIDQEGKKVLLALSPGTKED